MKNNTRLKTQNSKELLLKYFFYELTSNLFFERGIFIVFLTFKGLSILEITVFQGIINLSMMFAEIPTGIIADRIGKRNSLLLGNFSLLLYYILMIISNSFYLYIVAALIFGTGLTFISGTDQAYLYDLVPENSSTVKYLGRLTSIVTLALGIAMLLGGYFQAINWNIVFFAGAIMQFLGIIILLFMPNIIYDSSKKISKTTRIIKKIFKDDTLRNIIIFSGFNVGMVSTAYILGQEILSNIGMSTKYVSFIFFLDTIISIIILSLIEKITKKFNSKIIILTCIAILIMSFTGLLSKNYFIISLSIIILSVCSNFTDTIIMDCFCCKIDNNIRATGVSIFNMSSSLLMSLLFTSIGFFGNYYIYIISFLGVLSSILLIKLIKHLSYDSPQTN